VTCSSRPESDIAAVAVKEAVRRIADQAFPPRSRDGRFPPGVSGNPDGLSRLFHQAKKVFRDCSPEMAERLCHLALHAEDERVKCVALIAALSGAGLIGRKGANREN
jgi:hypothetical protein